MKKNLQLPKIKIFGKRIPLPKGRFRRGLLGVSLVIGGILGFLPILGYWMLPLGLFILSYDSPKIRRMRRRTEVWFMRRTFLCRWLKKFVKLDKIQKKHKKEMRLS